MAILSTVFVCMKSDLAEAFPEHLHRALCEDYDAEVWEHAKGRAYFMSRVGWYLDDSAIQEIYAWFGSRADDYKIIEACEDYPESTDVDAGCWEGNPWHANEWGGRVLSVSHGRR